MTREEHDLLAAALAHLEAAGLGVAEAGDSLVRVTFAAETRLYEVQLKAKVSPATAHAADRPVLVVAPHVPDGAADALRRQDVHYVDSVGNMYLRWNGLLLDVRGRRGPAGPQPGAPGRPLRAFKQGGLKILFTLLSDPEMAAAPYREIAMASVTSVGTVHWVLKELEEAGYVADRRLHRTRDLLGRWVEAYTFELWPRLTLGYFDAPDPGWWTRADDAVRAAGAQWGGETAAHHLNPHLRPGRAVLYAPQIPRQLSLDQRFRKADESGNVEVRQRFWSHPPASALLVPTPLIYADLVASADPRQQEAAADLRKNDALLQRLDRG